MRELERVEAQAIREAVVLGGGRAAMVGGAVCVTHPRLPTVELNRALPLGAVVDVAAIADWFGATPHVVAVPPGYLGLTEQLAAHRYERGYAWMKFERADGPAEPALTDLRVEETLDREAVALTTAEAFGMPVDAARAVAAVVGAPGFRCFAAFDGDEPAACGVLYADGEWGWLGLGATRPAFRRRGAQSALLAARIQSARALGVRRLTTETGERVEGRIDQSYRNILRAGFREAYVRPNWLHG